jgi:hypothetical protein
MPRVIVTTSALVIGLALASATDLAQNIQGPAAPNFGVNSNAQTGGMPIPVRTLSLRRRTMKMVRPPTADMPEASTQHTVTGIRRRLRGSC